MLRYLKRKQPDDGETQVQPTPPPPTAAVEAAKPTHHTNWREIWRRDFSWLEKGVDADGNTVAICNICRDGKITKKGLARGTSNLQYSAFSRHEKSNPDHLRLVEGERLREKKKTVGHVLDRQLQEEEKGVSSLREAEMRTMLFLAKNAIPTHTFNELVTLQKLNGAVAFDEEKKVYTSSDAHNDMIDAIDSVITDLVDKKLNDSKFIGLIIDETTDVGVHKKLAVYARVVTAGTPEVLFLDCLQISDGRAVTIVDSLKLLCHQKGLDFAKVSSLSSDGASVMMGRNNGVGVKLQRAWNPRLIHVHCIAHRLVLAASYSCKDVDGFDEFQRTCRQVYHFFSNSAVRYETLRELQDFYSGEDGHLKKLALKEPASFRWLSLHNAVKAMHSEYPAVVAALEHEAMKNNGSAEAKGLATKLKSVHFVLTLNFFMDTLPCLTKLSKAFQADTIDVGLIDPLLKSTIGTLELFKVQNGRNLQSAFDELEQSKTYRGVKVADRAQLRMKFQRETTSYLDALISNLEDRFDKSSMDVISALDEVLNPSHARATSANLLTQGVDALDKIIAVFGTEVRTEPEPTDGLQPSVLPPLIDPDRIQQDHIQFKIFLKSSSFPTLASACEAIISKMSATFPDFAILAELAMASPVTSVACERGFSCQNRLATKYRARLLSTSVSKLMNIVQGAPSLEMFDASHAVAKFQSMKKRRK